MSLRLAWLGAVLVVCAAACANIWQFNDLQTGPSEDASISGEGADSGLDFTAPEVRTDAFVPGDVHSDSRTSDVTSDVSDAGHADGMMVADAFADHECPTTLCSNGACVDTDTDPANCGSCASACPRGAMCTAGACKCPAAQSTPCSGVCVDLASDHNNCGGCGNACQNGYRCSNRSCVPCQSTDKNCGGSCVDVTTDTANCGSCGVQCPSGATCVGGTCTCPATDPSVCPGGGGAQQCVTLVTDHNNCGGCGNVCNLAHATSTCTSSSCAISACRGVWVDCDQMASDGCEANTITDTNNCGGCGHVCNLPHATPTCLLGICAIQSCSPGYGDCDLLPPNGCEVNTGADPNNCGGCGNVCNLPHATANCTAGSCTIASCNAGFADCDGMASNGCETDLSQPAHCGTCSNACGSGMLCSAGSCVSMCSGNMPTLCNGSYCANTTNDVNNCGSCGKVCTLANATAACNSSSCAIASCSNGFADCNKTASDGCEINTTNDVSNCGGCTQACNLANATATCSASSCAVKTCNSGFADCDGKAANGCEINTNTDANNCGMCGTKCSGGMTCQSGACACPAGMHDCGNGTCQSTTDPNHCGNGSTCNACTAPTNATATCSGSPPACGFSCNSMYTLCTSNMTCVNTSNDPSNCGACGTTCAMGGNCDGGCSCPTGSIPCGSSPGTCASCPTAPMNGSTACASDGGATCVATCNSPLTLCTNTCVNFTNDPGNCGGCGTTCQVPLEGGTATCSGSCGGTCPGSLTLCTVGGNPACVDTTVDPDHCGSCSNSCATPTDGGSRGCVMSMCL